LTACLATCESANETRTRSRFGHTYRRLAAATEGETVGAIIPPGRLVYGMQLPIQSQSTRYAEAWESGCGVDELTAIAQACDRAGFFYVAVCDHVAIPRPDDEVMSTEWWDTLTTLGYLAGVTERTNLLSHVYVLPYRHPLVVAKGFLTLDAVSRGRAVLGVGAGHVRGEFELLGVPFEDRGAALDESLAVVRAAFADEYPSHQGERWPVADAGQRPRPVRPGGIPVWVGGSSKRAMRRAAQDGDGWLPQGPPEMGMPAAIAYVHEQRAAAGRRDEPIDIGINTEPLYVGDPGWDVGRWCRSGEPEAIAERLRSYGALGVGQLQVRFRSRSAAELRDQVERFGAEVAPLLDG
jgi:probable F420-dependent oxidoreductase